MRKYTLWDKATPINGAPASHFLNQPIFKTAGDIILIYAEDGVTVTNVEIKAIIAKIYDLDATLALDAFMILYFAKLKETTGEVENG